MNHLILLHGALGTPDYFKFIEKYFASQFKIHKVAFSGHAGTAIPSKQITMQGYTNELAHYISEKKLGKVSIFGYSMGGYIGLNYAATSPDKVQAVMTLATKWVWTEESAKRETAFLDPEKIKTKVPKFAAQLATTHGVDHWEQLVKQIAGMLNALGKSPLLNKEIFNSIQTPTLIASGDKDNMVPVSETIQIAQEIQDADLAILPDTVHPFERINQNLLLQILGDFLKKNVTN